MELGPLDKEIVLACAEINGIEYMRNSTPPDTNQTAVAKLSLYVPDRNTMSPLQKKILSLIPRQKYSYKENITLQYRSHDKSGLCKQIHRESKTIYKQNNTRYYLGAVNDRCAFIFETHFTKYDLDRLLEEQE